MSTRTDRDRPTLPRVSRFHRHATEEGAVLAEEGLSYLVVTGSELYGTTVAPGDRDLVGFAFEASRFALGTARLTLDPPGGELASAPFERYEAHTAWDREDGLRERSGPGDVDVTVHSARRFATLLLVGNPSLLVLPFAGEEHVEYADESARELRENADRVVSRGALGRFLGYLSHERERVTGERAARNARPEVTAAHEYEVKGASAALRLALTGVELAETGRVTLPLREPDRSRVRAVRAGEVGVVEFLGELDEATARLSALRDSTALPPAPDSAWVDAWLLRGYERAWSTR